MKYSRLFLFLVGGLLFILLMVYTPAIVSPLPPDPVRLTRVAELGIDRIRSFLLIFSLLFFWLFVFLQEIKKTKKIRKNSRMGRAFLFTALILVGGNFLVNPRGLYPLHLVKARTENSRKVKVDFYSQSGKDQQIIIIGSSRTYGFSPSYIQKTLDYSTFNFSIFNGRVIDYVIISNFVFDQAVIKPDLLIIEVNPFADYEPEVSLMNTAKAFLPYMDDDWLLEYFQMRAKGLLSGEQFSEAVYTFFYRLKYPESPLPWLEWEVSADGGGIRSSNPYLNESLQLMKNTEGLPCPFGDIELQAVYLERLVQKAGKNGAGVIFVITPWHPDYYQSVLAGSESFQQCIDMYDDVFQKLQGQYDRVYYRNFSATSEIQWNMTELGFYDYQHMTPLNTNLIIDALADTIHQAMETKP
jgi:hypothetical protein